MSQQLDAYTDAVQICESYRTEPEHAAIIEEYERLQKEVVDRYADVQAFARINGPEDNRYFTVIVNAAPKRRSWDADKLLSLLPWLKPLPGIITLTVDDKALQKQLKTSNIDEATVAEALTITEGTPAVRVVAKEAEVTV